MLRVLFALVPFICMASCVQKKAEVSAEIRPNSNPSVPLSAWLKIESSGDYEMIRIGLSSEDHEQLLVYEKSEEREEGFPLLMVYPGRDYKVGFELLLADGKTYKQREALEWSVPELPEDPMEFPGIDLRVNQGGLGSPGYTLINPRRRIPINRAGSNRSNMEFGMLLVVDNRGEVLWYYRCDSRISDFDMLPGRRLSYLTQDSRVVVIDFMGNVLNQWYPVNRPEGELESAIPIEAMVFHHDLNLLPNGNRVILGAEFRELPGYYTSERDPEAPRETRKVMGDIIYEFTPEGELVWEWHAFDVMDPYRIGYETFSRYWYRRGFPGVEDWSHANAVIYDEKDDALIVNFRYQSALIKIDRKTKEVRWVFGEPSGWTGELKDRLLKPENFEDWFWHQHSPEITPEGNIILFNNDNYRARPFVNAVPLVEAESNIMEFAIDEAKGTARLLWSTRDAEQEHVLSIAMGDVDVLENGNVLGAYGALLPLEHAGEIDWWNRGGFPQWTAVREYAHTEPARLVWELRLFSQDPESGLGWTIFGAERMQY